jgi:predicted methyltransferase
VGEQFTGTWEDDMTVRRWALLASSTLAIGLAACSETETAETPAPAPAAEAPPPAPAPDYAALLSHPDRLPDDAADDAARKPVELLQFSKIKPGDTVLEIEAGGGWFTELNARLVGPEGKVYMQAPAEFEAFYKEGLEKRLANNRLPNVTFLASHFDAYDVPDGSVDVATWFLGPHELWFKPDNAPNGLGDPQKAFAEIYRKLKPGGYFVVLDHAAAAGAPTDVGNTLHRIDPAVIKQLATEAGFQLEEESALLANPEDDHTKGVFDPSIRRKTDQFLLRYVKPAA